MASTRRIEANRKNAQKCTGPKSTEGKAISSQNALKTGLDARSEVLRCESRPEYDLLTAEYYARFQPAVPEERSLVDDLIEAEWLSRRYRSALTLICERYFYESRTDSFGKVFTDKSETICRAQRCLNQTKRNFALALKQLNALQSKRPAPPEPEVEPEPEAPEKEELKPQLVSFLPVTSEATPSPDPIPEENPPIAA